MTHLFCSQWRECTRSFRTCSAKSTRQARDSLTTKSVSARATLKKWATQATSLVLKCSETGLSATILKKNLSHSLTNSSRAKIGLRSTPKNCLSLCLQATKMLRVTKKLRATGKKTECPKTKSPIFLQATTGGRQVQRGRAVLTPKFSTGWVRACLPSAQTKAQTAQTGWKSGTMSSCSTTASMKKRSFRSKKRMLTRAWAWSARTVSCRAKNLSILPKCSSRLSQKSRLFLITPTEATKKKTSQCESLPTMRAQACLLSGMCVA